MLSDADSATLAQIIYLVARLENDGLRDAAQAAIADLPIEPCPYTLAHTRHWCGNPLCRDS